MSFTRTWTMAESLNAVYVSLAALFMALLGRIFYMQRLHPLSRFPGPWYATSFSIVGAIVSAKGREHVWYQYLVEKYGGKQSRIVHRNTQILTRFR